MKNERFRSATFTGISFLGESVMPLRVNSIESQWDNRVVRLETTWEVFREFILQGHQRVDSEDRSAVKLFNAAEYKSVESLDGVGVVFDEDTADFYTRRLKENVLAVTMLILDYDGGMSLQEARERFKAYEYVGYTSFRHLKEKGVEKFRLVFPLATPIPAAGTLTDCDDLVDGSAWYELTDALKEFAGDYDPGGFASLHAYPPSSLASVHPTISTLPRISPVGNTPGLNATLYFLCAHSESPGLRLAYRYTRSLMFVGLERYSLSLLPRSVSST